MCWAALHRGLQLAEAHHLPAPLERWRVARTAIRNAVMTHGVDHARGIFVSAFGRRDLDAALLLLPEVEFIDYRDPLMLRTTEAIRHELTEHGLVLRYRSGDGLPGDEGVFLPCSFWLVDTLLMLGRRDEARVLFERLLAVCNDVGLLSEEYEPGAKRLLGNFPQAFSHVSLVNTARNFADHAGPAEQRRS
jgi:GH15 family glucan-1,4-alpha-glucosidase